MSCTSILAEAREGNTEFSFSTVIRGFHAYHKELDSDKGDAFAIAIRAQHGNIVGHQLLLLILSLVFSPTFKSVLFSLEQAIS